MNTYAGGYDVSEGYVGKQLSDAVAQSDDVVTPFTVVAGDCFIGSSAVTV